MRIVATAAAVIGACAGAALGSLAPARAQVAAAAAGPAPAMAPAPRAVAPAADWDQRAASRGPAARRRVLALYYPWYRTPARGGNWAHQEGVNVAAKRIASHVHYPASGPYDSSDPAVIDRHLRQAKSAGIDALVCSWWGRNDPSDAAIRMLCQRAPAQGMEVAIQWERLSKSGDPGAAGAELAYLLDTFAAAPTYLRERGRPVLFAYSAVRTGLAPDQWATVLAEANRRRKNGVLVLADAGPQPQLADLVLWDGLYNLGGTLDLAGRSPEEAARLLQESSRASILLARQAGRISVETLAPGYDDRPLALALRQRPPARPGAPATAAPPAAAPGTVVDRQGGRLWAALWGQARRDQPDWVLINSFNQWHTGTEIEPSAELGERYLAETAPLAERFRRGPAGGAGAPR